MGNSCVSVCLAFCSVTKIWTNINYPPKLNYLFGFRIMEQMEQMQQTPYRKFSPLLDLGLWSRLHCIVVALCSWRREGKLALGSHVATLLLSLIRLCDAIMNSPFWVRVDGLLRLLVTIWCFWCFVVLYCCFVFSWNEAGCVSTCCSCACFESFWTIFENENYYYFFVSNDPFCLF